MEDRFYFDKALSTEEITRMSNIVVELSELEINIYKVDSFNIKGHKLYSETPIKNPTEEYQNFQDRKRKYWYQIYYLLSSPNWVERLKDWIELLAPTSLPKNERLSQIGQIKVHIMNIIPHTEKNTTWRLTRRLFSLYGYDAGLELLGDLHKVEKDQQIKAEIFEILERNKKISKLEYRVTDEHTPDELIDILDNIVEFLHKEKYSKQQILEYLQNIGLYYYNRKSNIELMGADHFADYIETFMKNEFVR